MPMRKTKRGAERTPLDRDADVLICGASFAGLAVARELAGCGGLGVHPGGSHSDPAIWSDRKYGPAGYGWSFPADGGLGIGVGAFDPRFHVKDTTVELAGDLRRDAVRYQGNWIPHRMRDATEDGVFFAGDSAGHCLPLTAEGIRTALYFGLACGRQLRAVVDSRLAREQALRRYAAFSAAHARKFRWLLATQRAVGLLTPSRAVTAMVRAVESPRLAEWIFNQYLAIAPPTFVHQGPREHPQARLAAAPA